MSDWNREQGEGERITRGWAEESAKKDAELARLREELAGIDAALGNRSAFDDCPTRQAKVLKAINTAGRVDRLESELARVTKERDVNHAELLNHAEKAGELAVENARLTSSLRRAEEVLAKVPHDACCGVLNRRYPRNCDCSKNDVLAALRPEPEKP